MGIEFEKIITEAEATSFYIGLTDKNRKTYGDHFPPHLTKLVILDGKGRATIAQKHHKNQVWGTLKHWFLANNIKANDNIKVIYDEKDLNYNINVLKLIPISDLTTYQEDVRDENVIKMGAGFGNSENNKDVEKAAVDFVKKHYLNKGWSIESVEAQKCGFDLVAFKDNEIRNIEVKGISGEKQSFVITANEVRQAQINSNFQICLVTKALSISPALDSYSGDQFIKNFNLRPLSYQAEINK